MCSFLQFDIHPNLSEFYVEAINIIIVIIFIIIITIIIVVIIIIIIIIIIVSVIIIFIISYYCPSFLSFQPVLHDWCNKGCGMYYPVCLLMHIKEPLLLIGKSSPCGGSGFPLLLSVWSFTICLTPYNRK